MSSACGGRARRRGHAPLMLPGQMKTATIKALMTSFARCESSACAHAYSLGRPCAGHSAAGAAADSDLPVARLLPHRHIRRVWLTSPPPRPTRAGM